MCQDILQPCRAAWRPYAPINANAIKAECSIRLPKAAKTPLKIHPLVRLPLSTIVKELAVQAPLKPKTPQGTPQGTKTPINRNQLTQNRGLAGIVGKRAYESVAGGALLLGQRVAHDFRNEDTRAHRKALSHLEMCRAARRPNLPLKMKLVLPLQPVVAPLVPVPPAHPASTSKPIILDD
ncbi:UNVERIFIED_CONTAM: Metastasis-associated protein mta2 [Gekko kuhli]